MLVTCPLSGIDFQIPSHFRQMKLVAQHPIFALPRQNLLSRLGDWAKGKLSEEESKLLFLALLHTTGLVEFRCAAVPANSIVQKNMDILARVISWQGIIQHPAFKLPKFVVNQNTYTLENVAVWLKTWTECKKNWDDGYVAVNITKRVQTKEEALERLIKNSSLDTEDYAGRLASWALDASDAPRALWDHWTMLFKLKGVAVYDKQYTTDLDELLEHMTDNLQHGSIYSFTVLKHLRTLLAKNRAGDYGLGFDFNQPFKFVEDEVETSNRQAAIVLAPSSEPQAKDFANRTLYILAKARYNLAQAQVAQQVQAEAQLEDTILAKEEDEDASEEAEQLADDLAIIAASQKDGE